MLTVRLGDADAYNCTRSTYNPSWGLNPEARMVGLFMFASQLFPTQGTVSQVHVDGLDLSFQSVGNRSNPNTDPHFAEYGPACLAIRSVWGNRAPQWLKGLGQPWVSSESNDPNGTGVIVIEFPLPYPEPGGADPSPLEDAYVFGLQFWRAYLRATGPTTFANVAFDSCPCTYPAGSHARAIHVHNIPLSMAITEGTEMQVGIQNTSQRAGWDAADGTLTDAQRRTAYLAAWRRTADLHWQYLGDTAKGSVAYGGVFGSTGWDEVDAFAVGLAQDYGSFLYGMTTNCRQEWFNTGNEEEINYANVQKLAFANGQPQGFQTSAFGSNWAGSNQQPWGMGWVEGAEHALESVVGTVASVPNGVPLTQTYPEGRYGYYGRCAFYETNNQFWGMGSTSLVPVGGWTQPAGSYSPKQYGITSPTSIQRRTPGWVAGYTPDEPVYPVTIGGYMWDGAIWSGPESINVWDGTNWLDVYDGQWWNGSAWVTI